MAYSEDQSKYLHLLIDNPDQAKAELLEVQRHAVIDEKFGGNEPTDKIMIRFAKSEAKNKARLFHDTAIKLFQTSLKDAKKF